MTDKYLSAVNSGFTKTLAKARPAPARRAAPPPRGRPAPARPRAGDR
ncbi:hypothetical protein NKG05_08885 [Oerskovia sp. M15]